MTGLILCMTDQIFIMVACTLGVTQHNIMHTYHTCACVYIHKKLCMHSITSTCMGEFVRTMPQSDIHR